MACRWFETRAKSEKKFEKLLKKMLDSPPPGFEFHRSSSQSTTVSWEPSFLGGVTFLLHLSLTAVFALLLFYFLAESSAVLVDIARHIRLLVKQEPAVARGASSES